MIESMLVKFVSRIKYLGAAFPGLCSSTATSTTSVPTPAAPPAPVADMHWQPYHFIAPAPEAETLQKHHQKQQQQQQQQQQQREQQEQQQQQQQPQQQKQQEQHEQQQQPQQQQQQQHQQQQEQQQQQRQQQQADCPANKHSSARGDPWGIEPETFWIWGGLGGLGACSLHKYKLGGGEGGGVFLAKKKRAP